MSDPDPARRRARRDPNFTREEFAELVEIALDAVPEPFNRALDEVAVTVEDEPTATQRREAGLRPGDDLYGLFEGVPRTEMYADWAMVPSRITLFRRALSEDFPEPEELKHQIRVTVLHELGHYLGIDDRRLHELGVY